MERRDFLKYAGLAGVSVAAPSVGYATLSNRGGGSNPTYAVAENTCAVVIQMTGGNDSSSSTTPHETNNSYDMGAVQTAGNIDYPPLGASHDAFFQGLSDRMTVIRGIDCRTNSHDTGRRYNASGRLGEGYPNIAALFAGAAGREKPMAYLTFGGYDRAVGSGAAPTRSINTNFVAELAHPHRINPTQDNSATYHSAHAQNLIAQARAARNEAIMKYKKLPRYLDRVDALITAQLGASQLLDLENMLPDQPNADGDFREIELAVSAYAAGVTASINIDYGGFDTHGNHDASHNPRVMDVFDNISYLFTYAAQLGVDADLSVFLCSDFGRTPDYNGGNGKDHWSVGSNVLIGKHFQGDTVIGGVDSGLASLMLNPATLEEGGGDNAKAITCEDVHYNVRRAWGLIETPGDRNFILPASDFNLIS